MNRSAKIFLGLFISIGLAVLLLLWVDYASLLNALVAFNSFTFIYLFIIFAVGMLVRALRWKQLINQSTLLPFWFVFKALAIGYMVNNLLPAKVGELARMEYIKQKKGINRSFLLGTIFLERIIDLLLVVTIFFLSVLFSRTARSVFFENHWVIIVIIFMLMLSIYGMLKPELLLRMISYLPARLSSGIKGMVLTFSKAIQFLRSPYIALQVAVQSIFVWILTLLSSFLILGGLGISLPLSGYFFLVAAGVLGLVIPSTSGGIGVFHAVATTALVMLDVAPEKALAYAVIAHAFDFFPNVILGLSFVISEGISIKRIVPEISSK